MDHMRQLPFYEMKLDRLRSAKPLLRLIHTFRPDSFYGLPTSFADIVLVIYFQFIFGPFGNTFSAGFTSTK